jgi:hypothetical protein
VSPSANNRSTHRFDVVLDVEYRVGDRWHRAITENASLGGLFIVDTEVPVGQRLVVRLRLPTQKEPIEVGAVVRWQRDNGIGVQFDGLRAKDVWALGKYFESL